MDKLFEKYISKNVFKNTLKIAQEKIPDKNFIHLTKNAIDHVSNLSKGEKINITDSILKESRNNKNVRKTIYHILSGKKYSKLEENKQIALNAFNKISKIIGGNVYLGFRLILSVLGFFESYIYISVILFIFLVGVTSAILGYINNKTNYITYICSDNSPTGSENKESDGNTKLDLNLPDIKSNPIEKMNFFFSLIKKIKSINFEITSILPKNKNPLPLSKIFECSFYKWLYIYKITFRYLFMAFLTTSITTIKVLYLSIRELFISIFNKMTSSTRYNQSKNLIKQTSPQVLMN